MMLRSLVLISAFSATLSVFAADQPAVRVESPKLEGPRQLQEQTANSVVRDYLESWKTMSKALDRNQADLLDRDFIGTARDKLTSTIKEQNAAGLHTVYKDQSHDVQILFYSPEGLSVQLADTVEYDVQLFEHDKSLATKHVRAKYIVVLSPTEVRWRVRIFQAQPE